MSFHRWFDRRVDFGVMDVAEGRRPDIVRGNKPLQKAADKRLRELQASLIGA